MLLFSMRYSRLTLNTYVFLKTLTAIIMLYIINFDKLIHVDKSVDSKVTTVKKCQRFGQSHFETVSIL